MKKYEDLYRRFRRMANENLCQFVCLSDSFFLINIPADRACLMSLRYFNCSIFLASMKLIVFFVPHTLRSKTQIFLSLSVRNYLIYSHAQNWGKIRKTWTIFY